MKNVLFICTHNAARSQMAEAFFNQMSRGKAAATSAGTMPAERVNPTVVQVMREVGIDISQQKPKMLTLEMVESAQRVITMGCGVEGVCPATLVPAEDWELEDPEGKPIETVRQIRDRVKDNVARLIQEINVSPGQ